MRRLQQNRGFALLEILVATVILCGLIYMFIAFSQNQQRQLNAQNVGKQLAIAINTVVTQVAAHNGTCPNSSDPKPLVTNCVTMTQGFKDVLVANKLGDATVTIGP